MKGIGDGEPIASERFTVGGHEWVRCLKFAGLAEYLPFFGARNLQVLLFYPDGKRSSSTEGHLPQGAVPIGPVPPFPPAAGAGKPQFLYVVRPCAREVVITERIMYSTTR